LGTVSCNLAKTSSRLARRFTSEYSSSRESCGNPLFSSGNGRFVKPITLAKVVGVGYDRAHFVTAQPEIPLAPNINATFFDPFIAILLLFKSVEETSMSAGEELFISVR
jgi:hypothetical protein